MRRAVLCASALLLSSCSQDALTRNAPPVNAAARAPAAARLSRLSGQSKISHVVIIFQENRTPDNLFNGLKGADTVQFGYNSAGKKVKLQPISLTQPYDVDHEHRAYAVESDNGRMDGFNLVHSSYCKGKDCVNKAVAAYGFVPHSEVVPYFTMAQQYGFGDRMFQTNQGPSFPAHQYILSGTSTISPSSTLRASENPFSPKQTYTGGCDAPQGSLVLLIDANGQELQETYPCFDRASLTDLIDDKGLTWHYYQAHGGASLWNGPDAISHVRESSQYFTDVTWPPSQVLTDVANGNLANVVWVTPTAEASDHANITDGSGPDWVASVVNAIGNSQYWQNTVIVLTWDDWGGWYDHVQPPVYNSYELGFRVPLVVISAYTKKGYVSHAQHEFGSILKFTEETFGLGSLGTTDARSDDLSDFFDFNRKPRPFQTIPSVKRRSYFLSRPYSPKDPDDD